MGPNNGESPQLASLSPQDLETIADLVVAKLTAQNAGNVLPKQVVAGSSPVTRSTSSGSNRKFRSILGIYHLPWVQQFDLTTEPGSISPWTTAPGQMNES